ncbi:MAG: serine/threonine-protein kinase RsbW [Chthoniobacter sp.]|nr:serine/threonine-protein kinase RsbW [Chthoniobacter sp.]
MHEGTITVRLPADVKEIERLNRLVRQFGELHELPLRTLYGMNLALDEAVTNVILYGFDNPAGQEVKVCVEVADSEVRGEVTDAGREFNPLTVPPPNLAAPLEERELGGLGIHLLRSLMDKVTYRRENAKNVLTMSKRIR